MKNGIAGTIAKGLLSSKITVLLMIVFLVAGVYTSFLIPREEEPQIDVPMADIFVGYPGASPQEVESRVIKPLEKTVSNISGVDYVYSTSSQDQGMVIVQFLVGEDIERSYVKLYNELNKFSERMPEGASKPLVKTRSINDVPVMGLTLWSENYDDYQLRKMALELRHEIENIPKVSITKLKGGRSEELRVELQPGALAKFNLDILDVAQKLKLNHQQMPAGNIYQANQEIKVNTGSYFSSAREMEKLIVGVEKGQPVYLDQVAHIQGGPELAQNYVSFGYGAAQESQAKYPGAYPAVTLSIAKREGADAMRIAEAVRGKLDYYQEQLLPPDVHLEISRDYGETASHKVSELLLHLIGAIVAVTLVVMLAMGWRGGLVVFLSVPVTFALTLLSYYLLDYTLNRITLFALVFVTGIVVDDSIIIAENMHRHFKMRRLPFKQAAIYAINEVGNPTILATFTVIASVLPMAFVSGLMGPYMSPMPIGASIAMILSLFVALTIVPYLGYLFLKVKGEKEPSESSEQNSEVTQTKIYLLYQRIQKPLLESPLKRWIFIGGTTALLLASMLLFVTDSVVVKMLPFDNKNEFQVVIDLPEGTPLEQTQRVTQELGQYIQNRPEVLNYQTYSGMASPITFNGLVRHYDLRKGSHLADIQVNITKKGDRDAQSHDIAKDFRPGLQKIGDRYNAVVKVVEVPPGPPVLSTIVAEVYGPDYKGQINLAEKIKHLLSNTNDVVDVDWRVEAPQKQIHLEIDKEKAMLNGVAPEQISQTLAMALGNRDIAQLYQEKHSEAVGIKLALPEAQKNSIQKLLNLEIKSSRGSTVPLGDLVKVKEGKIARSIYRKNQRRVVYVTAEMAGELESPVYAILGMEDKLKELALPKGYNINEMYLGHPDQQDDYTVKWDGEWQITLEVFRDLGLAFGGVIVLIYMLIVGWFQSFRVPVVMMVAIPLSLVGIILGHWAMDAFFTATSFIGMIALAGIMVRNSVLLIDFVNLRLADGVPLKQAVIEAGAVRTTPILLTAGTVVIGAFVILFDPIFQGLAISLMGGSITATFLTLLVVPLVYYMMQKNKNS